ncbi:olfactory receptor 14I1-like [Vidua chalybeata]|uniref:olfactory receptor 14I1-like n=1 Tax=Vidua chalybeata TaxID=81927 RepID=UPI0023A7BCB0|nr:olfactory receptor 14I1-like [Vidua chalybeata]
METDHSNRGAGDVCLGRNRVATGPQRGSMGTSQESPGCSRTGMSQAETGAPWRPPRAFWRWAEANAQPQPMSNSSSISHFLLLALADTWQLQLLHFCLLLGISLAALLGNGLIISAGHQLHTPMFFFLLNLALSHLGSIGTTVPKAIHNSLWDTRTSSYTGCAVQLFFLSFSFQQSSPF